MFDDVDEDVVQIPKPRRRKNKESRRGKAEEPSKKKESSNSLFSFYNANDKNKK